MAGNRTDLPRAEPGSSGEDAPKVEQALVDELKKVQGQERLVRDQLLELQSKRLGLTQRPNGAAAAAFLSAALGVFSIGLLTTLAAANADIKEWLNWYHPTGPLSGKTILGVVTWVAAWPVAHFLLWKRETDLLRVLLVMSGVIAAGLLLMFPPIFQLLE